MRERNHPENWHLKMFVPFGLAALLVGVACGAPDEVRRVTVQTGGEAAGAGGSAGSGVSPGTGGSPTGGASATAPASSADVGGKPGGASGGKGGSVSSKGGIPSGGSSGKSGGAGGSGGAKTTFPSVGGASGGKSAAGGRSGSTGGANGGATSTSTAAPPTGLGVYVAGISSASGSISFDLRIDNKTAQKADLSTVTMRYWYQEESLGTAFKVRPDYVSIGYSAQGSVSGVKAVASTAGAGADHYMEFSMVATLAGQGDTAKNDQFTIRVTLYNEGYTGKVDVANDYSYNGGAIGYDDKITLHSGGKVIWGTPPGEVEGGGGGGTLSPDAGAADSNAGN